MGSSYQAGERSIHAFSHRQKKLHLAVSRKFYTKNRNFKTMHGLSLHHIERGDCKVCFHFGAEGNEIACYQGIDLS